ncbi:MAG: family 43 glycosylhydrolase [Nitrospira sp.]|nr:family 43 glycosylhydrolase [Nitrospira sp.]
MTWKRLGLSIVGGIVMLGCGLSGSVDFSGLTKFQRHYTAPLFGGEDGNFAGDPHVVTEAEDAYRMVYTTDSGSDSQAIGMAISTDLITWLPVESAQYSDHRVLSGAGPAAGQLNQETAFYYKTPGGAHHIYYIGYDGTAEGAYVAQIYRAISASNVLGPYTRETTPVVALGAGGSDDDSAMTSPSIVEYNGVLYMVYTGWGDSPNSPDPAVTTMYATSSNNGTTWVKQGSLSWNDIFGVEAHIEKGPDGFYYRAGVVVDGGGNDAVTIGRAFSPLGPYETYPDVLTLGGASVGEVASITSPSLLFHEDTATLYMFYGAVDTGGFPWMTSLARAIYR